MENTKKLLETFTAEKQRWMTQDLWVMLRLDKEEVEERLRMLGKNRHIYEGADRHGQEKVFSVGRVLGREKRRETRHV